MTIRGDLIACTAAGLSGSGRLLTLEGRAIAALGEGGDVTTFVASIGREGSLAEVIATLIAPRPSGLLVLGDPERRGQLALMLRDGIAVAAVGVGDLAASSSWVLEFHRRRLEGALWPSDEGALRVDASRTFLVERALDAIACCDVAGGSLLWLSGSVTWLGDELPAAAACDAGFLLLELARRTDEGPRLELAIGALDLVVVPISRPATRPARPVERRVPRDDAEDSWDFFDDLDPAAEAEWTDARHVFEHCDGITTIDQLVDRAMVGRFRTIQAVLVLLERGHVTTAEAPRLAERADSPDADDELAELADLIAELAVAV